MRPDTYTSLLAALVLACTTTGLCTQAPQLLRDINRTPVSGRTLGSDPRDIVVGSSGFWFTAATAARGRELWYAPIAQPEQARCLDIVPGVGASAPAHLTPVGAAVACSAVDGAGREPWLHHSSSSQAGRIADINPGSGSSDPQHFAATGNGDEFVFDAWSPTYGREPWVKMVYTWQCLDLTPGTASSVIRDILPTPWGLALIVREVGGSLEIRRSDGGAVVLNVPTLATLYGSIVGSDVWIAAAGRTTIHQLRHASGAITARPFAIGPLTPRGPIVRTSASVMNGWSAPTGLEPAVLDVDFASGNASLRLLADLVPGSGYSDPGPLVGARWFTALRPAAGNSVRTLCEVVYSGGPAFLPVGAAWTTAAADAVWSVGPYPWSPALCVGPTSSGRELFEFSSIVRMLDTWPGPGSSDPGPAAFSPNGYNLFAADDGMGGRELFAYRAGAINPVRLVKDLEDTPIGPTRDGLPPTPVALDLNGRWLLFPADDGIAGTALWRTDGTAAGTAPVRAFGVGVALEQFTLVGDRAYFVAISGTGQRRLWSSDGVTAAVVVFAGGLPVANPSQLTALPGRLVFSTGAQLCTATGIAATVLYQGTATGLTRLHRHVWFAATDAIAGSEPWRTDGTAAGTGRVVDLLAGSASSAPRQWTATGTYLFCVADTNGPRLQLLAPTLQSSAVGTFSALAGDHGRLWYGLLDATGAHRLWRWDGSSQAVTGVAWPRRLLTHGDRAVFDTQNGQVLVSDGTAGGTVTVAGLTADLTGNWMASSSRDGWLRSTDTFGEELWRVRQGTVGATASRFADLAPGAASSRATPLAVFAGRIWLAADDGVHGRELFSIAGLATAKAVGLNTGANATWLDMTTPAVGGPVTFSGGGVPAGATVSILFTPASGPVAALPSRGTWQPPSNGVLVPAVVQRNGRFALTVSTTGALPVGLLRAQAVIGPTASGVDLTNAVDFSIGN